MPETLRLDEEHMQKHKSDSANTPLPVIATADLTRIDNKTILTATGGFLDEGFTHTLNVAQGCAFGHSLCGIYCYAQHNHWVVKGRPWGLYGYKANVRDAYRREYDALKRPQRAGPKPLRLYMSSSTDPYTPQERRLRLTQALLQEMQDRPPDVLVIQTRSPLVARDLSLIQDLSARCELWLSMTVETDRELIPGFPNHATPLRQRLATLKTFHDAGVLTQVTVSPLLPLANPEQFARTLSIVCDRVILDHYLLGDGSKNGLRTKRTHFPQMLEKAGFGEWNRLEKFWEVKGLLDKAFGPDRVLVSAPGFNTVGAHRQQGGSQTPGPVK
jgi:DNA repair photolyase